MSDAFIDGALDTLDALIRATLGVTWVVIVLVAILAVVGYIHEQMHSHKGKNNHE